MINLINYLVDLLEIRDKITQREMDLAASIQKVIEEIIIKIAKHIAKETGGEFVFIIWVALNCVANGILLREKILIIFGYSLQPEMLEGH